VTIAIISIRGYGRTRMRMQAGELAGLRGWRSPGMYASSMLTPEQTQGPSGLLPTSGQNPA
jgi:hypothetical protein